MGKLALTRGEKTRKKLLQAAGQLVAKEGIHSLRFSRISKMAKVPQALMGYHFPTVKSLILDMIQQELEKLKTLSVAKIERGVATPREAFEGYIRAPFELSSRDQQFSAVWSTFYHLATVDKMFGEMNAQIKQVGRDRILNLIAMIYATESPLIGETLANQRNLLELATAVQGLVTGLTFMAATDPKGQYLDFARLAVVGSFKIIGVPTEK